MFTKKFTRRVFLKTALAGALTLGGGTTAFAKTLLADRGSLSLYNTHTKERLSVIYRNQDSTYDVDALQAINRILR